MTKSVDEAIGDPTSGYYIVTPHRPGRRWPEWSLRPYLTPYPNLADRWDNGGPFDVRHIVEMKAFMKETHKGVGGGVYVFEIECEGTRFFPSIVSRYEGRGHVSKWLDSLDPFESVAFPEVASLKLAQMLHRRGFVCAAVSATNASDDEWLPVHVRNFTGHLSTSERR